MDSAPVMNAGAVLHVGCGGDPLPDWLRGDETRLDLDESHKPDICADMRDVGNIGPFDTVYSSHALEHIFPHEVVPTLTGFRRILREGGRVIVIVPDLEDVRPTREFLYESPAGPICGLDMIYGLSRVVASNPLMAHKCGFTTEALTSCLESAGFSQLRVLRGNDYQLIGMAVK